jgi:hypothetical protein
MKAGKVLIMTSSRVHFHKGIERKNRKSKMGNSGAGFATLARSGFTPAA